MPFEFDKTSVEILFMLPEFLKNLLESEDLVVCSATSRTK